MSDDDYSGARASYDRDQNAAAAAGGGGKHRGPRFTWNPAFEATFFRSLCESVQLGLREGSTFKQEAWERATAALLERHHAYANKGHLINKSDNARKKFRLWRGLREDPEFMYNPNTRMVTASEEAWRRHIEKEPLSRSLKGRPFDHEEFYEILFPDVIGSGGAPKRVTKPRRKGPDNLPGSEEQETPGTAVIDLIGDPPFSTQQARVPSATVTPSTAATRPTSTAIPPRTSIASSSALTPPEENAPHMRKRFPPSTASTNAAPAPQPAQYKRRRTTGPRTTDSTISGVSSVPGVPGVVPAASALSNGYTESVGNAGGGTAQVQMASSSSPPGPPPGPPPGMQDGLLALAEALRTQKGAPRWQEQAMEIFFRDFGDEDMDLQLKIAEKALTDENKALVFCKMPAALRRHWIKRLREVHNRVN